jgi:hypothetical protein
MNTLCLRFRREQSIMPADESGKGAGGKGSGRVDGKAHFGANPFGQFLVGDWI